MFGFIGCGNMARAIIGGIINSGIVTCNDIIVSDPVFSNIDELKCVYNIVGSSDNIKTAASADILFLCVKPNILFSVLEQIKDSIKPNAIIVSIAAGKKISDIEKCIENKCCIVRVMPNTPALVGEGMSAIALNSVISTESYSEQVELIKKVFDSFGKSEIVPETTLDAVTALSGSSPAYVFMFIEAMADAAVKAGMPRDKAYTFAAQAVLGSAKMVLDTGKHPGELKDMVCSPAGTTIEAVEILEKGGFRGLVMQAMDACVKKSKNM